MLSQRIYRIRSQLIGSAGLHSLALPAPCQHSELRQAFKGAALLLPPSQPGGPGPGPRSRSRSRPRPVRGAPRAARGERQPRSRGLSAACAHGRLLRAPSHAARGCFCARVFTQRQAAIDLQGNRGALTSGGVEGAFSPPLRAFGRPVSKCSPLPPTRFS